MEIALLGPLSVTRDDRPLELGGARAGSFAHERSATPCATAPTVS